MISGRPQRHLQSVDGFYTATLGLCDDLHTVHDYVADHVSELCTPITHVAERQHLRSTSRHLLVVPQFQLDMYGCRTFAVAGPTTWNLF